MQLVKFTGKYGTYEFPEQSSGDDNFKNLVTATTRLAGVNGGFDEYGDNPAPQSVGDVRAEWWIFADHSKKESSHVLRDRAKAMAGWGKQLLFAQPFDPYYGKRFVRARFNSLNDPWNEKKQPHQRMLLSANFQVDVPGWQGDFTPIFFDDGKGFDDGWHFDGAQYFDDGLFFDDGLVFPGMKLEGVASNGATFTVTNNGNHVALPVITVAARSPGWFFGDGTIIGGPPLKDFGAGGSVSEFIIRRVSYGAVQDEFRWSGYLEPGEEVVFSSETNDVELRGNSGTVSGYGDFVALRGFGFPIIPPGESTIEIEGGFGADGGGDCYIAMHFLDTWY